MEYQYEIKRCYPNKWDICLLTDMLVWILDMLMLDEILNFMVGRRCWKAWLHFKSAYIIFRLFASMFIFY